MKTTVFMKEFDGRKVYSKAVKYQKDGQDKYAYFPLQFRKGVELANKTQITINKSWIGAYEGKNGVSFYEFVSDFDTVQTPGFEVVIDDELPFG
jgi:hypothetical protein